MAVDPATYEESPGTTEGEGVSLLREDESVAVLRRRLERPARLGTVIFLLLGSVVASAGLLLFYSNRVLINLPIALFGAILIVLGVAQYFLMRRDREHWPDRVFLWEGGVELVLHNGDVRGVSWTDPDLALGLVTRPARPPVGREWLLLWLRDKNVPTIELSEDGFNRVRQSAEVRRLHIQENRRGRGARLSQWIEIHPYELGQGATKRSEAIDASTSDASLDLGAPP
jgi:hypothetical protein